MISVQTELSKIVQNPEKSKFSKKACPLKKVFESFVMGLKFVDPPLLITKLYAYGQFVLSLSP